jgi:hypothetical protein
LGINRDKPDRWKADIARSVDFYNQWFMKFAPVAFRKERITATKAVEDALRWTGNLTNVGASLLRTYPGILPALRMCTCPPIARDRLIGLSGVRRGLVGLMEKSGKLPRNANIAILNRELKKLGAIFEKMADPDIFPWLQTKTKPRQSEVHRAATIVADRLCGAAADPIIRNAQEARQLQVLGDWLKSRHYRPLPVKHGLKFDAMPPGTYAFRLNAPVRLGNTGKTINIPIDAVVMPKRAARKILPILIEAKSAGDFTNVNKRRKEEAKKVAQLRETYGESLKFVLLLCGYFDSGYLGYEAADGIDWVWEHRIKDFAEFGL